MILTFLTIPETYGSIYTSMGSKALIWAHGSWGCDTGKYIGIGEWESESVGQRVFGVCGRVALWYKMRVIPRRVCYSYLCKYNVWRNPEVHYLPLRRRIRSCVTALQLLRNSQKKLAPARHEVQVEAIDRDKSAIRCSRLSHLTPYQQVRPPTIYLW